MIVKKIVKVDVYVVVVEVAIKLGFSEKTRLVESISRVLHQNLKLKHTTSFITVAADSTKLVKECLAMCCCDQIGCQVKHHLHHLDYQVDCCCFKKLVLCRCHLN
jgi:hypothetical protein